MSAPTDARGSGRGGSDDSDRAVRVSRARVLVVGAGGLGCPTLLALAHAGVGALGIADDDEIDASNLHRQILFSAPDVGKDKVAVAKRVLVEHFPKVAISMHHTRILPHNAREIVRDYDLIVEGSDNFPTKFLVADACLLEEKPVVHGAAIRWHGTAFSVSPRGGPCYRCVFEDIPSEAAASCATAGVMGPVVGVVGALMADLALGILAAGTAATYGAFVSFDGKTDDVRRRVMPARPSCVLCGRDEGRIADIDRDRYKAKDSLST